MEVMTRDQYVNIRKNGNIDITMLYEYYIINTHESERLVNNIYDFIKVFKIFSNISPLDLTKVFKYFDAKYEINILSDKNGNIVKIN
jgi:hypothetical protein